jgi:Fe2+ or Zn2+ uptake regulation protein
MRRGRPSLRTASRQSISEVLRRHPYPVTVQTVHQDLVRSASGPGSWNTVRKYLDDLASDGVVIRQVLPVERKRKPLVLYFIRGGRSQARGNFCEDF